MALESGAEKGDAGAQYILGIELQTEGNDAAALPHLWSAAQQGLPQAQSLLADLYSRAGRNEEDKSKALTWWYFAAEQGLPEAQAALGLCYAEGFGEEPDLSKAYRWMRLASKSTKESFQFASVPGMFDSAATISRALASWREKSEELKLLLTEEQLQKSEAWISEWEPKTWQVLKTAVALRGY